MARQDSSSETQRFLPEAVALFLKQTGVRVLGLCILTLAALAATAIATHNPMDPSWNTVSDTAATNMLQEPGAIVSDMTLQSVGIVIWGLLAIFIAWAIRCVMICPPRRLALRALACLVAIPLLTFSLTFLPNPEYAPGVAGWGGSLGALLRLQSDTLIPPVVPHWAVIATAWAILVPLALAFLVYASAIPPRVWRRIGRTVILGCNVCGRGLIWLVRYASTRRKSAEEVTVAEETQPTPRRKRVRKAQRAERTDLGMPDVEDANEDTMIVDRLAEAETTPQETQRARQGLLRLGRRTAGAFELPPLDLLSAPKITVKPKTTDEGLTQNAQLLVSVLKEFGIYGEIKKIRPGPVVTLYELEPAPGTKTSRVVGLADDIARSMSAISARIAVIPGQNAIGIELPNARRETVYLRELMTSDAFVKSQQALCLALGKDIGGSPEYVDLSRMPHLLIAGTTGSGKSVAVNTMILSLLYRLTPEQCRLIMIDPKMLELSVYDGIPHLLAPVVTDPGKAVVALKWAVREMEDRYRAMSQLGVRNIQGYNQKLKQVRDKGGTLTRSVQTSFDPETGAPIYEEQELDLKHLPNIVVIVDEMADLMLVAGKDVESAIQRLAQMARAAGIHLIMATQRPSVDVITGTIKANFPTRISFQVTSKIDSRTILGEQGAEQLLGQGDMLYMAAGGRITRVHGPFVSDQEVEDIVSFLRDQGEPDYVESVTEDPDAELGEDGGNTDEKLDPLYDQAVNIVLRDRKASTSYIQRQLQVGYNRAARMIECMERNGVVSPANHVGKREIFGGDVQH